jgi:hypothetical protein
MSVIAAAYEIAFKVVTTKTLMGEQLSHHEDLRGEIL